MAGSAYTFTMPTLKEFVADLTKIEEAVLKLSIKLTRSNLDAKYTLSTLDFYLLLDLPTIEDNSPVLRRTIRVPTKEKDLFFSYWLTEEECRYLDTRLYDSAPFCFI